MYIVFIRGRVQWTSCSFAVCRLTEEEVSSVVEQLEQDRIVASKRAKRLQEDLKKTQQVHTSWTRIHLPQDRPSARPQESYPYWFCLTLPTVVCFSLLCLCFHFTCNACIVHSVCVCRITLQP